MSPETGDKVSSGYLSLTLRYLPAFALAAKSNCRLISKASATAGERGPAPRGSEAYGPPTITYGIGRQRPGDFVEAIDARRSVYTNCEHTTTGREATVKELGTRSDTGLASAGFMKKTTMEIRSWPDSALQNRTYAPLVTEPRAAGVPRTGHSTSGSRTISSNKW